MELVDRALNAWNKSVCFGSEGRCLWFNDVCCHSADVDLCN